MSRLSNRQDSSEIIVRPFYGLARIHPIAAGLDIGAHEIMVCVPGPDSTQAIRAFGNLYGGPARHRRLVAGVWYPNGGDGVNRSVLDNLV